MLCPVCNEQPLKGRQTTCSAKCRSAKYRERKQQQRFASQRDGGGRAKGPEPKRLRHRVTVASVEQRLSSEVDRIVAAIQQLGELTGTASTAHRVDLREQVTSQAPKGVAGYRLVLPSRVPGDGLRLSPRRSRSREVAWYSLSPFEYPDDLRLRDGHWYHLVWYDAQGRRIRPPAEPGIPALYYFLGPPREDFAESMEELVNHLAIEALKSSTAGATAPKPNPPATPQRTQPSSVLATFPASLVDVTTETDQALLSRLPPLSADESRLVLRFVQQPEWIIQLLHEEKVALAQAAGQSDPPEPPTSLSHEERKTICSFVKQRQPRPFILLCKLLHAHARKRGVEALEFLPTPWPSLPDADVQRMRSAITDPQKRAYLEYLHTRQEALLRSLPPPIEPTVTVSGKEGQQLRRMMRDTRQIILFEALAKPPLTFLNS